MRLDSHTLHFHCFCYRWNVLRLSFINIHVRCCCPRILFFICPRSARSKLLFFTTLVAFFVNFIPFNDLSDGVFLLLADLKYISFIFFSFTVLPALKNKIIYLVSLAHGTCFITTLPCSRQTYFFFFSTHY